MKNSGQYTIFFCLCWLIVNLHFKKIAYCPEFSRGEKIVYCPEFFNKSKILNLKCKLWL